MDVARKLGAMPPPNENEGVWDGVPKLKPVLLVAIVFWFVPPNAKVGLATPVGGAAVCVDGVPNVDMAGPAEVDTAVEAAAAPPKEKPDVGGLLAAPKSAAPPEPKAGAAVAVEPVVEFPAPPNVKGDTVLPPVAPPGADAAPAPKVTGLIVGAWLVLPKEAEEAFPKTGTDAGCVAAAEDTVAGAVVAAFAPPIANPPKGVVVDAAGWPNVKPPCEVDVWVGRTAEGGGCGCMLPNWKADVVEEAVVEGGAAAVAAVLGAPNWNVLLAAAGPLVEALVVGPPQPPNRDLAGATLVAEETGGTPAVFDWLATRPPNKPPPPPTTEAVFAAGAVVVTVAEEVAAWPNTLLFVGPNIFGKVTGVDLASCVEAGAPAGAPKMGLKPEVNEVPAPNPPVTDVDSPAVTVV